MRKEFKHLKYVGINLKGNKSNRENLTQIELMTVLIRIALDIIGLT